MIRALIPALRALRRSAPTLSWTPYGGALCSRCGAFLGTSPGAEDLDGCRSCPADPPFAFARSLYLYGGEVREAIRGSKYGRRPFPSKAVAAHLLGAIRGRWADRFPGSFRPSVVPVPILPSKYFRRGFNLPALVGRDLARLAGWPCAPLLLARIRETRPQAGLPLPERERNIRGSFRSAAKSPLPPDLLILDDVYTTGATAAACARALKTAGGRNIVVVTVARAVP